jgi:hypothetical protein
MRGLIAAVAVLVVAACGPATPATPSPSAGPSDAAVPSGASLAPEICPIAQPPGPGDEPSAGGEIDTSGQGGGRAAACLVGPPQVTWEATAWCTWTPDRIAVEAVSGLPSTVTGDDGTWDAFLDLRASELQVSRTAPDGTVTTWTQTDVPAVIRDDGSDGLATFDAPLAPGSASPPPATPPRVAGVLRWQCAAPPPA